VEELKRTPPQPPRDNAVSPAEMDPTVSEVQGEEAERFMRACREMFCRFEDMLERAQPHTQLKIQEHLVALATKMQASARVQNIAACRLEVAAPLYLIFKMIIPVM